MELHNSLFNRIYVSLLIVWNRFLIFSGVMYIFSAYASKLLTNNNNYNVYYLEGKTTEFWLICKRGQN